MYLDGQPKTAFWKNSGGVLDDKPASQGGVDPSLAARTARSQTGSLVLGQVRQLLQWGRTAGKFTDSASWG
jgi:hypothetical protein